MSFRRPTVVRARRYPIRMLKRGRVVVVRRWYITLSFGRRTQKLPVADSTMRWLRGSKRPEMEPTNIALEHAKIEPELRRTLRLLAQIRGCKVDELNTRETETLRDLCNRVWRARGEHEAEERQRADDLTPPRGIRARKRPAKTKR